MGARALLHLPCGENIRRMNREELNQTAMEVEIMMSKLGFVTWVPNEIETKESFGDVDCYYKSREDVNLLKELGLEKGEYFKNGDMLHIPWNNDQFQVDLIKISPDHWDTARLYYGSGDLHNMIGKVARFHGMKHSHKGLFALYKDSGNPILLTKDPYEMMDFLGYDLYELSDPFETEEDLFEYALSSKYAHHEIFGLDNIRGPDRVRNKKRPQYINFIEYAKKRSESLSRTLYPKNESGDPNHIFEVFGDKYGWKNRVLEECHHIDEENRLKKERAAKRKKVVEHLRAQGYEGKELGKKVKEFLNGK